MLYRQDSHPDPADFVKFPVSPNDPSAYPYGAQAIGQALLHEIAHDELIAQRQLKGLPKNRSEYDADIRAMERIRDGWEKWKNSGFIDDSGYFFIFSLREGGYILTNWTHSIN